LLFNAASMGSFGLGFVTWKKPVRPGDILSCRRTTLRKRVSKSKPSMGIIEIRWEIFDQTEELKAITEGSQLMEVRNPTKEEI
jgi:acyl dehydratase